MVVGLKPHCHTDQGRITGGDVPWRGIAHTNRAQGLQARRGPWPTGGWGRGQGPRAKDGGLENNLKQTPFLIFLIIFNSFREGPSRVSRGHEKVKTEIFKIQENFFLNFAKLGLVAATSHKIILSRVSQIFLYAHSKFLCAVFFPNKFLLFSFHLFGSGVRG